MYDFFRFFVNFISLYTRYIHSDPIYIEYVCLPHTQRHNIQLQNLDMYFPLTITTEA
jgi:hypothetical protein